ncbi:MAG TPA: Sir2 family NAD-dependent protein deacetylase [Ktedonobacteraceae bacterium]|nr:Sir2 family NAD-dependent protein deacetylase [Ktedonobacteraceae bacterium]
MIWCFHLDEGFFCVSAVGKGGLYLNIAADAASDLPQHIREKYIHDNNFIIEYKLKLDDIQQTIEADSLPLRDNPHHQPTTGDPAQLVTLIKDTTRQVVFFTGAGISRAAGIWSSAELDAQLKRNDIAALCQYSVLQPETLIGRFKIFMSQIFLARPTPAHRALALIARAYERSVVTENVDRLHELTGITPLRTFMKKDLSEIHRLKPDVVILLGVSQPRAAHLLSHWCDQGAQIHLIYQGSSNISHFADFIYTCDLQTCLPEWQKQLGLE